MRTNSKPILVRLDAGNKFGMGHLSRCLSLIDEFIPEFGIYWMIKTDNSEKIIQFVTEKFDINQYADFKFLPIDISEQAELEQIKESVYRLNAFLIIDHYTASEKYQLSLKQAGIKWLQFDSHGFINFYANLVLHGSPGATSDIYEPLRLNSETEFLLGTNYAIVNKHFRNCRANAKVRSELKNVFMCFGGGNDMGAAYKVLSSIDKTILQQLSIKLIVTEANPNIAELRKYSAEFNNIELIFNSPEVHQIMATADLAIIPPGTLSYEAASVGLPMLLITLADNQNINARGWSAIGAAISLGYIENLSSESLNINLSRLMEDHRLHSSLSLACFEAVDGLGTVRTKNKILSIL